MEKMNIEGIESLSDMELLALITRSRNPCPFRIAESYATEDGFKSDLGRCRSADEISMKFELTKKQALSVLAAVELGKRVALLPTQKPFRVSSPRDAASYFMGVMRYENHEKFMVMLLDSKGHLLKVEQISEGSVNSSVVHPREVFAPAIIHHASAIIVAHNHPSGEPDPSEQDRWLTKKLTETGEVMGIVMRDHIVVGDGYYYSFKEHGDL